MLCVHLDGPRAVSSLRSLVDLVVQTELVRVVGKGRDEEEPGPNSSQRQSSIREPIA